MKTFEKIDFLMKITDTPNNILGKYLSFDSSYISRMRNGKRNLSKQPEFLESVSDFFAGHITKDYQKKTLCELICPGKEWPENKRDVKQLILSWLMREEVFDNAPIGNILSKIAYDKKINIPTDNIPVKGNDNISEKTLFFYGNSGKREAVTRFLSDVVKNENSQQLLLYSNEEFDWLYEDQEFAKQWAMLLFGFISKGGKIKIIHTISRASGEMLVALQKWIPIYKSGAIEPYYYPKILDRIFRKSMFIAKGHSAILSSSVGEQTEGAINCLITDKEAVEALENEYDNFFKQCKPLMQIFNVTNTEKFLNTFEIFNSENENFMTVRSAPSFYTMPLAVAKSMSKRTGNNSLLKRQETGEKSFDNLMKSGKKLTEILNLPPVEDVAAGKLFFPMCDLFDNSELFYTADEFTEHIENVISKLDKYEKYNVVLSGEIPENELVYIKEDFGVILVKYDFPAIAFVMNEQRMVSAFWDYLRQIEDNSCKKDAVIENLRNYISKLKDSVNQKNN